MTKKEKVIALKEKRYSYRTISEMLDMPIGTVKSIWSRKLADENLTSACKNCRRPVTSTKGRKRKQFCDDKCRMEWWNSHRYLVKAKTIYRFTCKHCGIKFTSRTHKKRKYCSHRCYLEGRYGSAK